jgi:hypothetical protein
LRTLEKHGGRRLRVGIEIWMARKDTKAQINKGFGFRKEFPETYIPSNIPFIQTFYYPIVPPEKLLLKKNAV